MMQSNGRVPHAGRALSSASRFDFDRDISHSKYESFRDSLSAVVISRQSTHW